jgi:hypothetical protein
METYFWMHQKHQRIFDKCLQKNLHLDFFCNNSLTPFPAAAQNNAKGVAGNLLALA